MKLTEMNVYKEEIIEEVATKLKSWYPDHVYINAICAAIRSMKEDKKVVDKD